jgi:adenylate cyclase, class 2
LAGAGWPAGPPVGPRRVSPRRRQTAEGRDILATLVTVPDLDGTFIEIETHTDGPAGLGAALQDVRTVLGQLGIAAGDFTSELYTDAVMRHRAAQ